MILTQEPSFLFYFYFFLIHEFIMMNGNPAQALVREKGKEMTKTVVHKFFLLNFQILNQTLFKSN